MVAMKRKGISLTYKFLIIMLIVVVIPAILVSYSSFNAYSAIEENVLNSISEIQVVTEDQSDNLQELITSETRENLENMFEEEMTQTRQDKIDRYSEMLISVEYKTSMAKNYAVKKWEGADPNYLNEDMEAGIWAGPYNEEEARETYEEDINKLSQLSLIFEEIEKNNDFVGLAYMSTTNNVVMTSTNINELLEEMGEFSAVERPWYLLAEGGEGVYWTTPYADAASDGITTTAAKPVYDSEGEELGVIGLDVHLSTMQEDLLEVDPGFAFLLDENGEAVVYPGIEEEESELGEIGRETFDDVNLVEDEDVDPELQEVATDMVENREGLHVVNFGDEQYYVSYGPMRNNDWSVGIARPVQEIEGPIGTIEEFIESNSDEMNHLIGQEYESLSSGITEQVNRERTNYIIMLGAFMILAVLVSFYFSKKITEPIMKLKDKAESISKGEVSEDIDIDTDDEIEELGDSFNRLMRTIKVLQKENQE